MKKTLLIAALAVFGFTSTNVQAQEVQAFGFNQGDIILEGNLGFSSTNDKNTETKTNTFVINPKVGYFLSEDFALGLNVSFASNKEEVDGTEVDKNSEFGIGAFGRYYFLDLGARFKTYAEFGLDFNSGKEGVGEAEYSGFGVGAGLGMNYFVTENIAINFALANVLSFESNKFKDGEAVSEFNGNVNVFNNFFDTAQFGLLYKF